MKSKVIQSFSLICIFFLMFDVCHQAKLDKVFTKRTAGAANVGIINVDEIAKMADEYNINISAGGFCGYYNLGICNVDEGNLNVREVPEEGAHIIGKLPKNAACEIVEDLGDWIHITSGKVDGYVSSQYLLTGASAMAAGKQIASLTGTATTGGLNVRTKPNTSCDILAQMPEGEQVDVISMYNDEWVEIDLDGETGYVFADYISIALTLPHAATIEEIRFGEGVSDARSAVVTYATQFVGNPYVWGGTSLTRGADCSGFVLSIYAKYGVSLPHSSRAQANCGRRIKASEAKPGDLFFYGNGKRINHVAIYIGGGQIVHAANRRAGIKISNAYYRNPVCVVSIVD